MKADAKQPKHYNVVVSGAGPGGLASAYEAARLGKKVLVVTDRKLEFVRIQRVFLDENSRNYLLSMLGKRSASEIIKANLPSDKDDIKFLKELQANATVAIKDIERFILRRIKERYPNQVDYLENQELASINMQTGRLSVKQAREEKAASTEYLFDDVIGADGAKHHAATTLNKSTPQQPFIKYADIPSPAHAFHMAAYVTLERKDGKKLELPEEQFIGPVSKIGEHTFTSGVSFDFQNDKYKKEGKKIKCTFGGEVPKTLYEAIKEYNKSPKSEDKKFIQHFIAAHLTDVFKQYFKKNNLENGEIKVELVTDSKKHGNAKDKMKFQAFQTEFTRADKAALAVGNRRFMLVGDAFRTPNYQFGHGLNDALKHAQCVGETLQGVRTLTQYNDVAASHSSKIEIGTQAVSKVIPKNVYSYLAVSKTKDFPMKTSAIMEKLAKTKPQQFDKWLEETVNAVALNYKGDHRHNVITLKTKPAQFMLNLIKKDYQAAVAKFCEKAEAKLEGKDYIRFAKHLSSAWRMGHHYSRIISLILREAKKAGEPLNDPLIEASIPYIQGNNFVYDYIKVPSAYEKSDTVYHKVSDLDVAVPQPDQAKNILPTLNPQPQKLSTAKSDNSDNSEVVVASFSKKI